MQAVSQTENGSYRDLWQLSRRKRSCGIGVVGPCPPCKREPSIYASYRQYLDMSRRPQKRGPWSWMMRHFRFRKTISLIPFFKGTVSKKGYSLNFNAWIFSRSWGNRGRSSTVDVPGTSGIFFRSEKRKSRARGTRGLSKKQREMGVGSAHRPEEFSWGSMIWRLIAGAIILAGLAGALVRLVGPELWQQCHYAGHPFWTLGLCAGLWIVASIWLWRLGARNLTGVALAAFVFWLLHWHLYGAIISEHVVCR